MFAAENYVFLVFINFFVILGFEQSSTTKVLDIWEQVCLKNLNLKENVYFSLNGLFVARTEVNISPKISAQPLKMALHENPAMHGSRIAIFLHEDKKEVFLHDYKLFFCTIQK